MKYPRRNLAEEINDPTDLYDQKKFSESLSFRQYLNISTTFTNCIFDNCYNQYGPGGAISYRKEKASLNIYSCQFCCCRAQYNAGAIFIQVSNGGWIQGNTDIKNSVFEKCHDCHQTNNYVAGVIEGFIAKGDNHFSFSLNETQFTNCQFESKNKITEGQMRLNTNIFHIHNDNITNDNEKIDASAFLFVKYVRDPSTLYFLNGVNQRGFTFFEIYNLEGNYIHAYSINMINSTFTNFKKDSVMSKIAFFNVYFNIKNCFYLDTFYAIDFNTISTDQNIPETDLVEPVIFQYADNSVSPITYNIFSNKKFPEKNKIDYQLIQEMNFDDGIIINPPDIKETPTASPLPTKTQTQSKTPPQSRTPTDSPTVSQSLTPSYSQEPSEHESSSFTMMEIAHETKPRDENINNSNNNSQGKNKMKGELIVGIVVGVIAVIAIVIIIVFVVIQKKRNRLSEENFKTDDSDINDVESNAEKDENDSNVCYQNNKFWKKSDPLNIRSLINTLNNYECSSNADDEDEVGHSSN